MSKDPIVTVPIGVTIISASMIDGEMPKMIKRISSMIKPMISRNCTFDGWGNSVEVHVLIIVHCQMVSVERKDGKKEYEEPQPVIWHFEQLACDVDDEDRRKAIVEVVNVVSS